MNDSSSASDVDTDTQTVVGVVLACLLSIAFIIYTAYFFHNMCARKVRILIKRVWKRGVLIREVLVEQQDNAAES